MVLFMKNATFPMQAKAVARLSFATLAVASAFPAMAQTRLPEVVVTATRFAEPASVLPFGVSVITADEIQSAGVGSVNEAVMKLLGVVGRIDTAGGNNYALDLRGFGSTAGNNQIVIVDGLRLNEADLSSAGLSAIPIASVERIEVLRGTGAVLYGEGATGGVIVITTKSGIGAQRKSSAQLYGAAGSLGLREARGSAVIASGAFSLDLSASERRSDGHRVNFASEADSVSATGQWSNDWLRLGARLGRDALSSGLPRALSDVQFAADPRVANSLTEYGASQNHQSGLFAEAILGNWQFAADINRRVKRYDSLTFGALYAYDVDASNASLRARHEASFARLRERVRRRARPRPVGTHHHPVRLHTDRHPGECQQLSLLPQGRPHAARQPHAAVAGLAHRGHPQARDPVGRSDRRAPARLGGGREPAGGREQHRLRAGGQQFPPGQCGRVLVHQSGGDPASADLARRGVGCTLEKRVQCPGGALVPQPAAGRDRLRPGGQWSVRVRSAPTSTSIRRCARGWSSKAGTC
jgi:hypothetical protein